MLIKAFESKVGISCSARQGIRLSRRTLMRVYSIKCGSGSPRYWKKFAMENLNRNPRIVSRAEIASIGGYADFMGHSLNKNTVVWASAGTGKTRKLVEVYLDLLEQGIDPMRIVAMTFTEKAAAEMRDRIRTA